MKIKEYVIEEDDKSFNLIRLQSGYVSDSIYNSARDTLVRTCHDIFLRVKPTKGEDGILLIKRQVNPAKGLLWCIGGGIRRGMSLDESLKHVVKRECNLDIKGQAFLIDLDRFFFRTNPYGTEKGIDDFGLAFYAVSSGQIKLDELHSDPIIVSKKNYGKIKPLLHPYIKNNMDKIFKEYW